MTPGEEAVSVQGLARLLGLSPSTVYTKANSGDLPGVKVGRVWRFFPSEVRSYLDRPRDPWAMSPASARARRVA